MLSTGIVSHWSICNSMLIEIEVNPYQLSHITRKPAFCIIKTKAKAKGKINCAADQALFCSIDSTINKLPKSEFSSLYPSSVAVMPSICQTWSETPKTSFLTTRIN